MKRPRLRLLISAGPTREPIDPVRFLSNASTGAMGAALAAETAAKAAPMAAVTAAEKEKPGPDRNKNPNPVL